MAQRTFATAINCMDGRTQLPVNEYLRNRFKVGYIDTVTEPGPINILAENAPKELVESIKTRVDISVNKHGSKVVALVGHHDCAGNPVEKQIQLGQLDKAVKTVASWGFDVEIIKLYVDETWRVETVD